MKSNRTTLFIAISSIALLIVLIIQINWISEASKIKEDLFDEKASIILARTTEAIGSNKIASPNFETSLNENERRKIDSLIQHFMKFYNFKVDYSFEIIKSKPSVTFNNQREIPDSNKMEQACYDKSLHEMSNKNGWELKLNFPEKEKLIRTEMRIPFITSILLILVVLILFWKTILSLTAEKKISEHTSDFLNNMTHEFKTPLTNISLAGKMILKDTNLKEEKIKHYSGIILEENEKLRLQVEQVLSMTALERGEIPVQKTELDFHILIQNCLKLISIQIENKQGDLKLNLKATKFVVMGDKTHLSNALSNLIDNAIKYSQTKPEITISTTNIESNLIVVISDKGIGIDKLYHKKVFKKYFRIPTGNVHNTKGFGLGLAYVKKIIELHNGTIELESEKEKGSRFTIILPYV